MPQKAKRPTGERDLQAYRESRVRLWVCSAMAAVTLAVAVALDATAWAVPGDLDSTFGSGGVVTTNFGNSQDEARAVAIQPDGKIVVVGYTADNTTGDEMFPIARYLCDGTLDPTFGVGGKVKTPIGTPGYAEAANAVALQANGDIVVAGHAFVGSTAFALARYKPDGTLDTAFNGGGAPPGIVTTVIGSYAVAQAVAVQPGDQKIVAAGYSYTGAVNSVTIARYETTGALDPSFGAGGTVTTSIGTGSSLAYALVIQPVDGKIVVGGRADTSGGTAFALARYLPDGTLDSGGFNSGGVGASPGTIITPIGSYQDDFIRSLALQPLDQKIVAVGQTNGPSYRFTLARYLPDGTLDTTGFNGGGAPPGVVMTDFGQGTDGATGVALQPDGKIVAAGFTEPPLPRQFALARYLAGGSLDGSFGPGATGKVTTAISGEDTIAFGLALQPGGKIVLAGETGNTTSNFALARYEGDAPDPCGGPPPTATPTPTVTATVMPTVTATKTPTPSVTPSATPTPDHFTCYSASATGPVKFPGITNPPGISLVDHFGSATVAVKKTKRSLCAPTNKLGEDPTAKTHPEHLTGYPVTNGTKPPFPTHIRVVDQFNASGLFVDAKKRSHLLVPTVKSLSATPPTPAMFTTDHFECYTVKVTKGTPPFVVRPGVTLEDQFGTMTVTVKKPAYLCLPVDKAGEDATAPSHVNHLMCYEVKQTAGVPFKKDVFVNNQFGPQTLTVKKPEVLCVPALKDP